MIRFSKCIICLSVILSLFSCDTNKKLKQENAEKAIKEFVQNNSIVGSGGWGQVGSFDVASIISIEPLSQFSENEASTIACFNYQETYSGKKNLTLKFNFKRNIDKQWYLINIEGVAGVGSETMSMRIYRDWKNLNILAQ
jgi:hypothetical protein